MPIPRTPIKNPDPFARAIPGQSLTDSPGLRPYEKPPSITTPGRLLETIEPVLKEEKAAKSIADILEMGLSCETIAEGICKKYFTEGAATPDVVELAKPGIFMIVAKIGDDHNVDDMKLFIEGKDKEQLSEIKKVQLMQKIAPEKYQKLEDRLNWKDTDDDDDDDYDEDYYGDEDLENLDFEGGEEEEEYDDYDDEGGGFLDKREVPARVEYEDED